MVGEVIEMLFLGKAIKTVYNKTIANLENKEI